MSERYREEIARRLRIQLLANATLNDAKKADRWLHKGLAEPNDMTPLAMAKTAESELLVKQILAKISWGAAA